MSSDSQIAATIKAIQAQAARCVAAENSDNYGDLDGQVETLESRARETIQSQLAIESLLAKLKGQQPLGPAEWKTLEMLMVGESESFLKYEADFSEWKEKANTLIAEISRLQLSESDVDGLMHLRALCQELRRVLPNIVYYLDQKERAAKFQETAKGPIDPEGYHFLSEIIESMISSEKM